MGGDATATGIDYQASVVAYVYVHILTGSKLRWLPVEDDTPTAISGETRGPGDDGRIEFGAPIPSLEVQAKSGLRRGRRLDEVFERVKDASDTVSEVALVVDSKSSRPIRIDLKHQLERIRAGRTDELGELADSLCAPLGAGGFQILGRVRVIVLDPDWEPAGRDATSVVELLSDSLEDEAQAEAAWNALVADAVRLCAKKSRRTRRDLVDLLKRVGIKLRPPKATRRWHDDLRHSKQLLRDNKPEAALDLLGQIEAELTTGSPDGATRYRLNQHKASASRGLGRFEDAIRFAQTALDHDSKGIHAMADLAIAYSSSGETTRAREIAERMLQISPEASDAWLVRVHVATVAGEPLPVVPDQVAETPDFRKGWAAVCLDLGREGKAQEIASSLLAEGDRSPGTLWLRVQSLLCGIDHVDSERRRQHAEEVERLCAEIVEGSSEPSDAELSQALMGRSAARRILGRPEDARDDVERALLMRPNDPEILLGTAQARALSKDFQEALSVLQHPVVVEHPALLVIRAGLLADSGDKNGARRDLDRALSLLRPSPEDDSVRLAAIEAAIELGDIDRAKWLFSVLSEPARNESRGNIVLARISALENDLEDAEHHYRTAVALDPSNHDYLLAELGQRLVVAGRTSQAVSIFEELSVVPAEATRAFVHALVDVNRLLEAQQMIDVAVGHGTMHDWVLHYAAQIALRRNDRERAAQHLEQLVARGKASDGTRFRLAATLLELDLPERAETHVDALRAAEGLTAADRMRLAQLLLGLKRTEEAVVVALRAYRESPNNPEINRVFVGIVLNSKTTPEETPEVGPGTHVRLVSHDGDTLEYVVLPEEEDLRLPNEITLDDARAIGLLGLRIDQSFVRNEGKWMSKKWTIALIQPVVKFVFNDILAHYDTKFPAQPFFVSGHKISSGMSKPSDLQPLVASAHDRRQHLTEIFNLYGQHVLPLEMVATLAGVSISAVMQHVQQSEDRCPLWVEWSDEPGAMSSRTAVREAGSVVLTRSAVFSLWQLGIHEAMGQRIRLLAPRTLRDQLRRELVEAEEWLRDGRAFMGTGGRGLEVHELPAGHEVPTRERDNLSKQLAWLDTCVEVVPRPLEAFGETVSTLGEVRAQIGDASHDSVELACHEKATLYADDLGLRALAKQMGVSSFSSVALVQVLPERGAMTTAARDRTLVDLTERHYATVRVTPEMLLESLEATRTESVAQAVFASLSAPNLALTEAADILVSAIRRAALKGVRTRSTGEIMRRGLAALAQRFTRLEAAEAVERSAHHHLDLLPLELARVQAVCQEIRRESRPR